MCYEDGGGVQKTSHTVTHLLHRSFTCIQFTKPSYFRWLLASLTVANFVCLLIWCYWAWKVSNGERRQHYVLQHFLNVDEIAHGDAAAFAATLSMSSLLLVEFIEDHADRVFAGEVCMAFFRLWQEEAGSSSRSVARVGVDIPLHLVEDL